ncbi:MAG: tetratricopeptide repeat protein [Deltaproteobacteria bacterium]|nr:tetratricopeptide repeat protein [Deltaproteobacteria bacterium]
MTKKRVSRSRKRELETPDEFVTVSSRMIDLVTDHKEKMIIGVGILIALIVGFVGRQYYSERAENKAFALLEQSRVKYQVMSRTKGPEEVYVGVEKDFQQVLDKYSGSDGGKIARVIFADICFNSGNYDRAIRLYETSLEDFDEFPFIKNVIRNSLGHAHEKKKDYPTAVKYFEMIVQATDSVMKSDALFNLGVLYAEMGLNDKSTSAFKEIISNHSDAIYYEIVKERLAG